MGRECAGCLEMSRGRRQGVVGRPPSAKGTVPGEELSLESNPKLPIFVFPNTIG